MTFEHFDNNASNFKARQAKKIICAICGEEKLRYQRRTICRDCYNAKQAKEARERRANDPIVKQRSKDAQKKYRAASAKFKTYNTTWHQRYYQKNKARIQERQKELRRLHREAYLKTQNAE